MSGSEPKKSRLIDTNIAAHHALPAPKVLQKLLPAGGRSLDAVAEGRQAIKDILDGKDERLFVVVGPCSIHDPAAAIEYANRLRILASQVRHKFALVMRVYFEKPRTHVGWKGLINDPHLNGSYELETGLKTARSLLLKITAMGLPTATEALDPIMPQYLAELVSWHAIGARTTESQTHRELASGLSTPVGFKNSTDGNVQAAMDAMRAARAPHHFLGVEPGGRVSIYRTKGNAYTHVVLRGGKTPNYEKEHVREVAERLEKEGLRARLMVDCSHGNSGKDPLRQPAVFESVLRQREGGRSPIAGVMLESNLKAGRQDIPRHAKDLKYGVSVTDACLGWDDTERLLLDAAKA